MMRPALAGPMCSVPARSSQAIDPPPAFDYPGWLDFLASHGHNFIRLWTWEQPHSFDNDPSTLLYFAPFPWPRTGPGLASDGKPTFDLSQLDPAYFDRMRARVIAARDRGIYVSVMLFDGWDLATRTSYSSRTTRQASQARSGRDPRAYIRVMSTR